MKILNLIKLSTQMDQIEFELYRQQFIAKVLLFLATPLIGIYLFKNLFAGRYSVIPLLILMLVVLICLFFTLTKPADGKEKHYIFRLLLNLLIVLFAIFIIYVIGVEKMFDRIPWVYILPILSFYALSINEGLVWTFFFCGIVIFFVFTSDMQSISLETLKIRFLIAFLLTSVMSFIYAYTFRRDQENLVKNHHLLKKEIHERRLSEEALQKSEASTRRLAYMNSIMAEIGRVISSTLDIEEVYERFAEEVRKLIPFDRISINLVNPDQNTITIAYAWGVEIPDSHKGNIIPLHGTATEKAIRERTSFIIHAEDEQEIAKVFPGLLSSIRTGLRSMIIVSLIYKEGVIGVLHLRSYQPNIYTERELKIAVQVGHQITGAITNALLYAERKQAEMSLRESEKGYRNLFDEMPLGLFRTTPNGKILDANPALLQILGYHDRESLLNMNVLNIYLNPEQRAQLASIVEREGIIRDYKIQLYRRDGSIVWVSENVRVIRDETGRALFYEGSLEDITERKESEQKLAMLQEQLRQSQKIEAIGQLAGGVAHDFNNLLTVIRGFSEISLLELKEGDPLRTNIEEIQKATHRATDLTQQLLAFGRRQIMQIKILDLNTVIRDLSKMLHRIIGEGIELVIQLEEHLGKVKGDLNQVQQAIINLVINARDEMSSGGKLMIETNNLDLDIEYPMERTVMPSGHYVLLSVSDTGKGMAPEVRERIFEPFFTTKEMGKGTGLGLSTVYGIVKQSGGYIWVYSELGHGTTFKIYFPRVDDFSEELLEKGVKNELPRGGETILLVEDEEGVRKVTKEILDKQGYRVLEASHGGEALDISKNYKGTIHLLITDIVMPRISGHELAKLLEKSQPHMKILFISGYMDGGTVQHGMLENGGDFLQKPFSIDELIKKIRVILENNIK